MATSAKTNLIAVGAILALLAIGGINKTLNPPPAKAPDPLPTAKVPTEPSEAMMILVAQKAVKGRLRDPESAMFRNEQVGRKDGQAVVICGEVNARNGFGGMTGYQRFMSNGADVTALESDMQDSDISGAWNVVGCK